MSGECAPAPPDLGTLAAPLRLQRELDSLGERRAEIRLLSAASGRVLRYIDEGDRGWRPMVFFGGLATSVGAFGLTEFARTTRELLKLRVLSIERNGYGETPFNPRLGYADAVEDILAVLAAREVERFVVVAFSGGGPYAAALAAQVPERIISLHLAAAAAGPLTAEHGAAASLFADAATVAADPRAMWRFPVQSSVQKIPGFTQAAADEGVRALATGGRGADALAHEWGQLCARPLPDLAGLDAPTYLYWGSRDEVIPPIHIEAWGQVLPRVAVVRRYEGEGHDVPYRHWDQILLDSARVGAPDRPGHLPPWEIETDERDASNG